MNFKRFTSPHVLKRKTAGGRVKRQGKQIYEPQKPPPRPLSFAGADFVRVERSSPGLCPGRPNRQACPSLRLAAALPRPVRWPGRLCGQDWKPPPEQQSRRPAHITARLTRPDEAPGSSPKQSWAPCSFLANWLCQPRPGLPFFASFC